MDRFERVTDLLWRENPVAAAQTIPVYEDELYSYDGLNRLQSFDRGDLNGTKVGLVASTKFFAEDGSLNAVENWTNFKQDTNGNEPVTSTRTAHTTRQDAQAGQLVTHFERTLDAWTRLVKVVDGDNSDSIAEYVLFQPLANPAADE